MEQAVLRIALPDEAGYKHGSYYRGLLSELSSQSLPSELYWRDALGKEILDRPGIRWMGGYKGVIINVTPEYEDLIVDSVPSLMKVLRKAGIKHTVEVSGNEIDVVECSDGLKEYCIPSLCTDMLPTRLAEFESASVEQKKATISAYIADQLVIEAEAWGVDPSVIELNKRYVKVHQLQSRSSIKYTDSDGEYKRSSRVFKVNISAPFELCGRWQVGKLLSKGFGEVRYSNV